MNFLKNELSRRLTMSLFGTILTGTGIGGLQKANFGVDPYTCLVTGLANLFQSTYSTFYIITTAVLLILTILLDKKLIGIATVLNLIIVGNIAAFSKAILDAVFSESFLLLRIVMLISSLMTVCFATSLYYTAELGVSSYDAVALSLADRITFLSFGKWRVLTDMVCVLFGLVSHVTIGLGTVITAFMMGPAIQWCNHKISIPLRYGQAK